MRERYDAHLAAFSALMGGEDEDTIQHCLRLRADCATLGVALGLDARARRDLEYAALLHDIGMFRVPHEARTKVGNLSETEWAQIRRHPDLGADMVAEITTLEGAAELVRCHHERWDGEGYPRGLVGATAPLGARILTLIDAFDSICNRSAGPAEEIVEHARGEILSHAGRQFDPAVVQAFDENFATIAARRVQEADPGSA